MNGYTKGARNELFALRPAPVQVSYLLETKSQIVALIIETFMVYWLRKKQKLTSARLSGYVARLPWNQWGTFHGLHNH